MIEQSGQILKRRPTAVIHCQACPLVISIVPVSGQEDSRYSVCALHAPKGHNRLHEDCFSLPKCLIQLCPSRFGLRQLVHLTDGCSDIALAVPVQLQIRLDHLIGFCNILSSVRMYVMAYPTTHVQTIEVDLGLHWCGACNRSHNQRGVGLTEPCREHT